jgi:hypothetical protein
MVTSAPIPFRISSLFLFFHPDVHLRELKKVWMDELIYDEGWRNFMVMLQSEWEEFILNVSCILRFLRSNNAPQFDPQWL